MRITVICRFQIYQWYQIGTFFSSSHLFINQRPLSENRIVISEHNLRILINILVIWLYVHMPAQPDLYTNKHK